MTSDEALIPEGMINVDSEAGRLLSFTSDRWHPGGSYLWKADDRVIISAVLARESGKGYLSDLFNAIWNLGFTVAVPTPLPKMQAILIAKDFEKTINDDEDVVSRYRSPVTVWIKGPPGPNPNAVLIHCSNCGREFESEELTTLCQDCDSSDLREEFDDPEAF